MYSGETDHTERRLDTSTCLILLRHLYATQKKKIVRNAKCGHSNRTLLYMPLGNIVNAGCD